MKHYPSIDLGRCSRCFGCTDIAPEIFRYDPVTGMIIIADLQEFPEDIVNEAIKNCPKDCIQWDVFELVSHG